MGKRKTIHDKNQPLLPGFEGTGKDAVSAVYKEYRKVDRALRDIIRTHPVRPESENEFQLCNEIATDLSREIRESGMSRDEFCDRVNAFFGRTDEDYQLKRCRKPLAVTDIEKWFSDTANRPIHAYYLYAFQHVLGFGVANGIVSAKGGKVMSQEDRRLLALAQIGELEIKMREAKKALKQ